MRRTFGTGLAVALLALALGCGKKVGTAPGGPSDPSSGPGNIQGTWLLVALEADGEVQDKVVKSMSAEEKTLNITPDQVIFFKGGQKEPLTYKLDPSKNPNEIDMSGTKRDGKPETMYGIYKFEGDKLTICAVKSDEPADRPKELKTHAAGRALVMVFEKK